MITSTAPVHRQASFRCPHCRAFAHQEWHYAYYTNSAANNAYARYYRITQVETAQCAACNQYSIWYNSELVYPRSLSMPAPHKNMPDEVKGDYLEAANIAAVSPRSAAALLRLSVQKLTIEILKANKTASLNDNIKELVKRGLPEQLQQALDIVRVTGNNAVHPGEINLRDDLTTATKLFELVNLIVDYMIAKPKQVADLYNSLVPETDREKIAKRDGRPIV